MPIIGINHVTRSSPLFVALDQGELIAEVIRATPNFSNLPYIISTQSMLLRDLDVLWDRDL